MIMKTSLWLITTMMSLWLMSCSNQNQCRQILQEMHEIKQKENALVGREESDNTELVDAVLDEQAVNQLLELGNDLVHLYSQAEKLQCKEVKEAYGSVSSAGRRVW